MSVEEVLPFCARCDVCGTHFLHRSRDAVLRMKADHECRRSSFWNPQLATAETLTPERLDEINREVTARHRELDA